MEHQAKDHPHISLTHEPPHRPTPPTGKSRLLAALCLLVARVAELAEAGLPQQQLEQELAQATGDPQHQQQQPPPPPLRVLVAASTNVAVDRVLTLLHEFGCVIYDV